MKIVVIGATGRLGSAVVSALQAGGHTVVEVSRHSGIDAYSGEGLADAVAGADALIDAGSSNDPDAAKILDYFTTTTRNLTTAARDAGLRHYVAIGIVGTDAMQDSGYYRGKRAQERGAAAGGVPYTIVRLTQFYEFLETIAEMQGDGNPLRVSDADIQPLAVADAGTAIADIVARTPADGIREVAGPEAAPIADFVGRTLAAAGDERAVMPDAAVPYFGAIPERRTLVPGDDARLMPTRFEDWLREYQAEHAG